MNLCVRASYHPAKFSGHRHCGIDDRIVLVCHEILQDHAIKVLGNFMGKVSHQPANFNGKCTISKLFTLPEKAIRMTFTKLFAVTRKRKTFISDITIHIQSKLMNCPPDQTALYKFVSLL